MKKLLVIGGLVVAAPGVAHAATAEMTTCFAPVERCEPLVVSAINAATQEILVQSHTFTSRGIAAALEAARKRGVRVQVIFDKSEDPNLPDDPQARELVQAGIPVVLDSPEIARRYRENWAHRHTVSKPVQQ